MATSQDFVNWICSSKLDHRFLKYVLLSERSAFLRFASGTTHQTIYFPEVKAFHICLPSPGEQGAIGHILQTLDDKIEVNRRMSGTLEAIARALFKAWFVDFEPVRAKAEGRDPGLPPHLAAHFPDRLVENQLGAVPDGWRWGSVADLLELAYGKALKATERAIGPVPVYGSGGVAGYHDEALIPGPAVIVGRKGSVGTLYWEDDPCFPIDTVFYVAPRAPLAYCFHLLGSLGLEGMNTDAAVPGLNRNNVYRLDAIIPDGRVLAEFDRIASGIRGRIRVALKEARNLAALRDTLLPKLISGELRVRDAETFLDRVL